MIERIDSMTYSIDTAGIGGDEKMHINLPPCRCGQIENGVGLDIGGGGWVIATDDFLAMAEIVRRHRAEGDSGEETK